MKQILASVLIYSFVLLGLTACPNKATIEKAEHASAKLAGYASLAVSATGELYRQKIITLEQKDRIADALIMLAKVGAEFDKSVTKIKAEFGEKPPQSQIDGLIRLLKADLVPQFSAVLSAIKIAVVPQRLKEAIEAIRSGILLIAAALDVGAETKQIIGGTI